MLGTLREPLDQSVFIYNSSDDGSIINRASRGSRVSGLNQHTPVCLRDATFQGSWWADVHVGILLTTSAWKLSLTETCMCCLKSWSVSDRMWSIYMSSEGDCRAWLCGPHNSGWCREKGLVSRESWGPVSGQTGQLQASHVSGRSKPNKRNLVL